MGRSPKTEGATACRRSQFRTVAFSGIVTSLTRPVSAASGRDQFRTGIFSKSLLPLQSPVSAASGRDQFRTGIFCDSLLPLQSPVTIPGKNEAQTKAPLVKGGCLGTAEAGGFRRLAGVHIGLFYRKVPAVNPSVTPSACQLPFAREPVGSADTGLFQAFNRQRGIKTPPKSYKSKTGAEAETPHPSQSEGSIFRWFLPGDSQGGNNSSGSELFPP